MHDWVPFLVGAWGNACSFTFDECLVNAMKQRCMARISFHGLFSCAAVLPRKLNAYSTSLYRSHHRYFLDSSPLVTLVRHTRTLYIIIPICVAEYAQRIADSNITLLRTILAIIFGDMWHGCNHVLLFSAVRYLHQLPRSLLFCHTLLPDFRHRRCIKRIVFARALQGPRRRMTSSRPVQIFITIKSLPISEQMHPL